MRNVVLYSLSLAAVLAFAAPALAEGRRPIDPVERRGGINPVERSSGQVNGNTVQGYIPGDPAPSSRSQQDMDGVFYTLGDDGSYRTYDRPARVGRGSRVPFEP